MTMMTEVLSGGRRCAIVHGLCEQALAQLPQDSIDALVSDVPYGLGEEPTPEQMLAYLRGEAVDLTGGDFMGRSWSIPSVAVWRECFRVLKPGAHAVVFASTRTWDLISMGLRFAGFENRDTIRCDGPPALGWVGGQGFPKGVNLGKAADHAAGAKREVVGIKPGHEEFAGRKTRGHLESFAGTLGGKGGFDRPWMHAGDAENYHLATAPATDQARALEGWSTALKPAWEVVLVFRKPIAWVTAEQIHAATGWDHWCQARAIKKADDVAAMAAKHGVEPIVGEVVEDDEEVVADEDAAAPAPVVPHFILERRRALHAGASSVEVLRHAGGELVLKESAYAPWSVLTLAANAIVYGTGGVNVDACRVASAVPVQAAAGSTGFGAARDDSYEAGTGRQYQSAGRWPANMVLQHAPACERLGERRVQSGVAVQRNGGGQALFGGIAGRVNTVGARPDASYADEDGTEAVEDWRCAPGCPVAQLDAQSGDLRGRGNQAPEVKREYRPRAGNGPGEFLAGCVGAYKATFGHCQDSGGASRFFPVFAPRAGEVEPDALFQYGAKVSEAERLHATSDLLWARDQARPSGVRPVTAEEWAALPDRARARGNIHITVKPVALMRWLVRLVAPRGGVVLDPYGGSGTTAVAALVEGARVIAAEMDEDHVLIAAARTAHAELHPVEYRDQARRPKAPPPADPRQRSLF